MLSTGSEWYCHKGAKDPTNRGPIDSHNWGSCHAAYEGSTCSGPPTCWFVPPSTPDPGRAVLQHNTASAAPPTIAAQQGWITYPHQAAWPPNMGQRKNKQQLRRGVWPCRHTRWKPCAPTGEGSSMCFLARAQNADEGRSTGTKMQHATPHHTLQPPLLSDCCCRSRRSADRHSFLQVTCHHCGCSHHRTSQVARKARDHHRDLQKASSNTVMHVAGTAPPSTTHQHSIKKHGRASVQAGASLRSPLLPYSAATDSSGGKLLPCKW